MKIAVCIKQVPTRDWQPRVNEQKTWVRDQEATFELNEPDAYALEESLRLREKHGGEVPRTMDKLTALAGVGRKTANVVLGNAFDINVGIVVDTHVTRLANRLGLTRQSDAVKIEQELMPQVPREQWTLLSHWLIWHGRRRCDARKPDCAGCEIAGLCPSAGKV